MIPVKLFALLQKKNRSEFIPWCLGHTRLATDSFSVASAVEVIQGLGYLDLCSWLVHSALCGCDGKGGIAWRCWSRGWEEAPERARNVAQPRAAAQTKAVLAGG